MKSISELSDEAKRLADLGNYAEAVRLNHRIIGLLPPEDKENHLIHYLQAASANRKAGCYAEALNDCRSAIAIDPNVALAWRILGIVYLDSNQPAQAEDAFLRSLELGPAPGTYVFLSHLRLDQRNLVDAERYSRLALDLNPNFEEAYFRLGVSLYLQRRTDEASDAFRAAINLDPDYALAHREFGAVLLEEGKLTEAETHLRKVLETAPEDDRTLELLGKLSEAQKSNGRDESFGTN